MDLKMQLQKKEKLTFIGFLFAAYYATLVCYNKPIVLYTGYILIAGLIILNKLFSKDRLKIEFPTACKCLYYFTVYCYFSRFWAWNEYLVISYSKFLIPAMILLVVSINYFIKTRSTKACIYALILSGLALSIYVIADNGGLTAFYNAATQKGNRLTAGDRNENFIGYVCALSIVSLFYYAVYRRRKICFLISALPLVVLMTSGSRTAMGTLAVGIAVIILLSQSNKKGVVNYLKIIAFIIVALICARFILSLEMMSTIRERLEGTITTLTGSSYKTDGSTTIRMRLIEVGWEQFKETPFLGIGFGNSPELNWRVLGYYYYSHNEYIEHLINGGVISFVLYYSTILYIATKHIKLMRTEKKPELIISFATIVMYLIKGIGGIGYYGQMHTYLCFTLWISVVAICEREHYENEQQQKALQEGTEQINSKRFS